MYPSTFTIFTRPGPTDRLNNPSHSSLHNTTSSAVGQLEAFVGLSTSSAIGTLMYDVRSPDSNGGGHVQTVNKGGTGQTSYTKGDLLVAQSSSALTKLSISSVSGEVLVVDPSQPVGMKWAPVVANKVAINTASVTVSSGAASGLTVLYAASILGSTLGINNAIKFTGVLRQYNQQDTFTLRARYGNNTFATAVATIDAGAGSSVIGGSGTVTGMLVSSGATNTQVGYMTLSASRPLAGAANASRGPELAISTNQGSSSVESLATQDLVITGQFSGGSNINSILTGLFVVEKII